MSRKKSLLRRAALVIIILTGFVAATNPTERYFEISRNLDIFATLFKEVNAIYVDEVNPNTLIKTGIDAMLESLDPYTNYIPEDAIEDFRTQSTGQYGGIGAITSRMDNITKIVMIYKGFSADKSGLKIGDEIIKINDIDITKKSRQETSKLMKGQANTEVKLAIRRYGENELLDFKLKREKITVSSVPYYGMLTDNVGYIKLTEFTQNAGKEVKKSVEELKEQGALSIVLDLRGNPGGLLLEAVNIVNVFVPRGMEVVTTKGKISENNTVYKTLNTPVDDDIPLVVMVNSGSASASEIVAGTVQDYDRGIVIGQKSFGKGLVQVTRPLSYNSQLKVTTAKYYTPSGRCIQALDYSHRNADGSVGKVPDSLKVAFQTKNGRTVYDGGGVDPDIKVDKRQAAPITLALYANGLIFDYATKYYYEHPEISTARNFSLSNAEYQAFVKWLADKDVTYNTKVEEVLTILESQAKDEKSYESIKGQIEALRAELKKSKASDLEVFKEEIKFLLEEEIASRYYFEKGAIESSFEHDWEVLEAIKILNDRKKYLELLG
ncbi:MAG: S41 family peptidase [Bacteroidota bacterium]